jgi:serine/threonine protein kinase
MNKEKHKVSTGKSISKRKKSKVIGEGGFGCVLNPNVTCKLRNGSILHPNYKLITKLMEKEDLDKEYNEIHHIMAKIKSIPNYKSYFVIDIHQCKPNNLTEHDLNVIYKGCKYFKDMSASEINQRTNSLVMEYAGKRTDKYIQQNMHSKKHIMLLHQKLCALTAKGIKPLNQRNVFHCDIKLQNILYHRKKVRLIDWGFTYIHKTDDIIEIPPNFQRYPLHFNMPITVCLFGKNMLHDINFYISDKLNKNIPINFDEFGKYVWNLVLEKRYGHYSLLQTIYVFLKPVEVSKSFDEFAVDIYSKVLQKYTSKETKQFHSVYYFQDFYLNNVDIIGITSCYISFMRMIQNRNAETLHILWRYFAAYYFERINIDDFIFDIKQYISL